MFTNGINQNMFLPIIKILFTSNRYIKYKISFASFLYIFLRIGNFLKVSLLKKAWTTFIAICANAAISRILNKDSVNGDIYINSLTSLIDCAWVQDPETSGFYSF